VELVAESTKGEIVMTRSTLGSCIKGICAALVCVAILTVLAVSMAARASDMDAAAQALVRLDDDWSDAAATRDAAKVASFYAEDAIAYPPGATAAHGRAESQAVWASYFAEPTFQISWKTTHAQVEGDLGFTSGTYEDSYKGAEGATVHENGKYLCVWQKQSDGSWKAIHDMWNTDK